MTKNSKIKICGIRNEKEALFCDKEKIDFLGFNFYKKSPRYIESKLAKEIILKLNFSVPVGLFVNEEQEEVLEIIKESKIKIAQFHGDESSEFLSKIPIKTIKSFGIENENDFEKINKYSEVADFFLLDSKSKKFGGTGQSFNWEVLKGKSFTKKVFLAGGLNPENLNKAFDYFLPFAIDIASGVEIDGKKDIDKIKKVKKVLMYTKNL